MNFLTQLTQSGLPPWAIAGLVVAGLVVLYVAFKLGKLVLRLLLGLLVLGLIGAAIWWLTQHPHG